MWLCQSPEACISLRYCSYLLCLSIPASPHRLQCAAPVVSDQFLSAQGQTTEKWVLPPHDHCHQKAGQESGFQELCQLPVSYFRHRAVNLSG